jgi:starch phosphorylase
LHEVHFGRVETSYKRDHWKFSIPVYLGDIAPEEVQVQLYADPVGDETPLCYPLQRGNPIPGAINGYVYHVEIPALRSADHFTPRIIPYHPEARVPMEAELILWQR